MKSSKIQSNEADFSDKEKKILESLVSIQPDNIKVEVNPQVKKEHAERIERTEWWVDSQTNPQYRMKKRYSKDGTEIFVTNYDFGTVKKCIESIPMYHWKKLDSESGLCYIGINAKNVYSILIKEINIGGNHETTLLCSKAQQSEMEDIELIWNCLVFENIIKIFINENKEIIPVYKVELTHKEKKEKIELWFEFKPRIPQKYFKNCKSYEDYRFFVLHYLRNNRYANIPTHERNDYYIQNVVPFPKNWKEIKKK